MPMRCYFTQLQGNYNIELVEVKMKEFSSESETGFDFHSIFVLKIPIRIGKQQEKSIVLNGLA